MVITISYPDVCSPIYFSELSLCPADGALVVHGLDAVLATRQVETLDIDKRRWVV